jgi:hypothetical protein
MSQFESRLRESNGAAFQAKVERVRFSRSTALPGGSATLPNPRVFSANPF